MAVRRPGKPDFPAKIVAAARAALADGRAMRLVNDESARRRTSPDLADAIAGLAGADVRGIHHVVNAGIASRADWARDVLGRAGRRGPDRGGRLARLSRPSTPPRWGVLEPTPLPGGPLRDWREAMADRIATMELAAMNVPVDRDPGVVFGTLQRHADVRGGFAEAWRARGGEGVDPFPGVQANLSLVRAGRAARAAPAPAPVGPVDRVSGVAFVALVDVRPMLAGADRPVVETATLGRDQTVRIPPHVAHGFLAVEPLELLYLVTNEYDASDELGFAWDDPQVAVPWPRVATPDGRPILRIATCKTRRYPSWRRRSAPRGHRSPDALVWDRTSQRYWPLPVGGSQA